MKHRVCISYQLWLCVAALSQYQKKQNRCFILLTAIAASTTSMQSRPKRMLSQLWLVALALALQAYCNKQIVSSRAQHRRNACSHLSFFSLIFRGEVACIFSLSSSIVHAPCSACMHSSTKISEKLFLFPACPISIIFQIRDPIDIPATNFTMEIPASTSAECARVCYNRGCQLAIYTPKNELTHGGICKLTLLPGQCQADAPFITQRDVGPAFTISCIKCANSEKNSQSVI